MKALKKKTKIVLIVAVVAVLLLLAVVLLFLPELIVPVLWTLLILGVGFFAVEWYFRSRKRAKQKNFDEKVAAKEGIEDRKREWAGWIEELDRQGIDRYELPFYLVVGEPQSGKSVLLQNSDLYFPFGQERLSGVGGTRGCDWWFTDEAVILDIAGRLFTHEGGIADKLEWEAFLDQLNAFRPLCPANGVLLIIPCDALLEDSPEVCADKANKIQSALLTLTQKLQAQLPVYLVLTKGDRIFGFAESVHRLDGDQRHQMFGWSREPDKAEQPFALEEAKVGFARLVDRARLLREKMVASARIPEALPEVDRLYAFPDELQGMYPALEIYLKRIFTQSSLVDRTSFRGIYLCSGLQTGAPVAKVCAQLLGDDRESDARALESLFSHQRAYFIKDLIRNRVFTERGLVRPTEGRVLAARRNAWLGYGAAAALAVVAVVGSAIHLLRDRDTVVQKTFRAALAAGHSAAARSDIQGVLLDLHAVDQAVRIDRELMDEVFSSTRESFAELYTKICDRALLPKLRAQLEKELLRRAQQEPASYDDFRQLVADAELLYEPIDFGSAAMQKVVQRYLPTDWFVRVTDEKGATVDVTIADALAKRTGAGSAESPIGGRDRLVPLAARLQELLNRSIDPATPWMVQGHLGFMVGWKGAQESLKRLKDSQSREPDDFLKLCDVFANSVRNLDVQIKSGKLGGKEVKNSAFLDERSEVVGSWGVFEQFLRPGEQVSKWTEFDEVESFAAEKFAPYKSSEPLSGPTLINGNLGRKLNALQSEKIGTFMAKIPVPSGDLIVWIDDSLGDRVACDTAPNANWTLGSIESVLGRSVKLNSVYHTKVRVLAAQIPGRLPDWAAARADYYRGGDAPVATELDQRLLAALASIRRDLGLFKLQESAGALHLSKLIEEHLRAIDGVWSTRTDWGLKTDWSVVRSLLLLAGEQSLGPVVCGLAEQLAWQYLNRQEARLLREWIALPHRADQTLLILAGLNEHLAKLKEMEQVGDPAQPVPMNNPDHQEWFRQLDEELAGRVRVHVEAIVGYWTPSTVGWKDLRTAVAGVKEALTAQAVRQKIAEFRKVVDAPAADAAELRTGQPVRACASLPVTTKALDALRALTIPSETDVRKDARTEVMSSACVQIDQHLAASNSKELAAVALATPPLPAVAGELTTVDHYLRPLQQALRDRLVADVRSRYVRKLADTVLTRGPAVMDALYASGAKEVGAVDDQEILRRLGQLLDAEGQFDLLRREYGMIARPEDPQGPTLRPEPGFTPPAIEAGWWQFENFLVDLQGFLRAGGAKVADVACKVKYELPSRAVGAWDMGTTGKQFCYYAIHSAGKGSPGFVSFSDRWGLLDKPLEWSFQVGKRPALWFVWTHKLRTQAFKWPSDRLPEDLAFELTGSLAPLQLAWSGSWDAGWWDVQCEPEGTTEKARLRLSFQSLEGTDMKLPVRPARPTPF